VGTRIEGREQWEEQNEYFTSAVHRQELECEEYEEAGGADLGGVESRMGNSDEREKALKKI